ncbi:MAG: glycosyl transferase family 2 [Bacteroidetes bacterium HGW-Bacteroidetes-21]|nr:MAG: glycosyl transferase family 2 [Bacteroidetes bacterium HGW-Bacteroidetes-21]
MISVDDIHLSYGGFDLFRGFSFMLKDGDRAGLVGRNGAGKTTIMKIITGEVVPSSGRVNKQSDLTIGYLPQHLNYSDTTSVFEEVNTAFREIMDMKETLTELEKQISERTDYESAGYLDLCNHYNEISERISILGSDKTEEQIEKTLTGLGFKRSDFTRPTAEFSGGWRMRIELAKILLKKPMLLLLDEPTNHLDMPSIQWLEETLSDFTGALLLVSHDRIFLDTVTNRTIEISLGKIFDYKVAYSKFESLSEERRKQNYAAWENQQKLIKETEDFVERFRYKATKAVQVQSRIKQLEKLDRIEVEQTDAQVMRFKFLPSPSCGNIIVEAKNLKKAYNALPVFDEVNFTIEKGERVALVGRNGEGKTTLSRIIIGDLSYEGLMKTGHQVKIGYYAQNQHLLLDENKTVFQTLDDVAVGDVRTKLRDILGSFLFSGEDIDKKVVMLSGGEKARLSLARLLLSPFNLLIMDEPTNHLDMMSRDILKKSLLHYDGTIIIVSHDRYFLDGLATRVIEFADGRIKDYPGNIADFLYSKKMDNLRSMNAAKKEVAAAKAVFSDTKTGYIEKKEQERARRKIVNRIEKLENQIAGMEDEMALIEKSLSDPSIYNQSLHTELLNKYNELKKQNDGYLSDWEMATNELDAFDNPNAITEN